MIFIIPRRRKEGSSQGHDLSSNIPLYLALFSTFPGRAETAEEKHFHELTDNWWIEPYKFGHGNTQKIEELSSVLPRASRIKEAAKTG